MKHIHFNYYDRARNETYEIDLFQSAADVLTVCIKNIAFINSTGSMQIDIPVKKAAGFCWKVTKTAVYCDTGNAADLIDLFTNFSEAYAHATVRVVCFENERNRRKIA